jgi:hypothetical protein
MSFVDTAWREVTTTLRPPPNSPDGQFPPLLLALTLVTGLVDAASYLKLGYVFVANMTGNVVFLGFGIAGAGGVSVWASLTALGSFLVGGVSGGRIGARWSSDRARHLTAATSTELLLVPPRSWSQPSRPTTSTPRAATRSSSYSPSLCGRPSSAAPPLRSFVAGG